MIGQGTIALTESFNSGNQTILQVWDMIVFINFAYMEYIVPIVEEITQFKDGNESLDQMLDNVLVYVSNVFSLINQIYIDYSENPQYYMEMLFL